MSNINSNNFHVGQRVYLKQGFGLWATPRGEPIAGTVERPIGWRDGDGRSGVVVRFDDGSISTHHSSALIAVDA